MNCPGARRVVGLVCLMVGAAMAACSPPLLPDRGPAQGLSADRPEVVQAASSEQHASENNILALQVYSIAVPPVIDGNVDEAWHSAQALSVPWRQDQGATNRGSAPRMTLLALQSGQALYLLAQWEGEPPSGQDMTANKLTMHWRVPDALQRGLSCNVVCHTAFADGDGRFAYANAETIPSGGDEHLMAAGSWHDGLWTFEWSRPLRTVNPYDLQFDSPEQWYHFSVKLFEGRQGQPDPQSQMLQLRFGN